MDLKSLSIGIVGNGVVGNSLTQFFTRHVRAVHIYDIIPAKCTQGSSLFNVLESDLIFICLPTPKKHGSNECDTSVITNFFASIPTFKYGFHWETRNYVIKSTVPVGFTKKLSYEFLLPNVVHSPEFLTERSAITDTEDPKVWMVGIPDIDKFPGEFRGTSKFNKEGNRAGSVLVEFYRKLYPSCPRNMVTTSNHTEMIKLGLNAFYATKIGILNELNSFCMSYALDWDVVLEGMVSLGTINPSHTQIPGPDGQYGFGGKCLPKDIASLCHQMTEIKHYLSAPLIMKTVIARNCCLDRNRKIERETCPKCIGNMGWYESTECNDTYLTDPNDGRDWKWVGCSECEGTGYTVVKEK